MLTQVLTHLGGWAARLALVALLVEADNPYRLAAGLAFIAAQVPIQRAILSRA
jgi:hypothetical protein